MKILLARTVDKSPYSFDYVYEDTRLAQVHSILAGLGLSPEIDDHRLIDLNTSDDIHSHAKEIISREYDLIVHFVIQPSSSVDFTRRWLQIMHREIRSSIKKRPMVFLAGDVNVGYSIFFERQIITGLLLGDEVHVAKSIKDLTLGIKINDLSHILYKNEDNEYIKRFDNLHGRTLENLPHGTLYVLSSSKVQNGQIKYLPNVRVTRGCYASCSFCHETLSNWRIKERHIHAPIKWIEKELSSLYSHGVREVLFKDSNFLPHISLGDEWVSQFSKMMNENFSDLIYSFWTRGEDLSENRLELLSKTGLSSILIGVESLVETRLKFFKKGASTQHTWDAVALLKKFGIEGKLSFILFQPDQTLDELQNELEQLEKLMTKFPNVQKNPIFAYNLLIPHSDTPLFKKYSKQGFLVKNPTYNFEEHFTYMSGRKTGNHELLPYFQDHRLALLCEAFRLYQYEYAKKWFVILNEKNDRNLYFKTQLPERMLHGMRCMFRYVSTLSPIDINPNTQKKLTNILYTLVIKDYSSYLTSDLRNLETPNSINYAVEWKNIVRL